MIFKHWTLVLVIFKLIFVVYAIDHLLLDSYRPEPTPLVKSYEKILKMSLKSLYFEDEREHNFTAESILLSQNCSLAFDQLSDSLVNFTKCGVKNARPVHICVECKNEYYESVIAYENLKRQGKDCQDFFFSSDQVAIVDIIYNGVTNLWLKNYCQNCNQYPNLTESFFDLSNILINCVLNKNKTELLPSNLTCEKCHDLFANLSYTYSLFVLSSGDNNQVCMDVVDTMNMTRKIWKDYNCIVPFDMRIGYPNIIVALAIGVTPCLFYLLAKNVSITEDIKIVRPKRKFTSSITIESPKE